MKILYIVCLYNGDINGGHSYRMATVKALKNIVGEKNIDIVLSDLDKSDWNCNVVLRLPHYNSLFSKIWNLITGNITQRSDNDIKKIIELIKKKGYDVVIFGSSETGKLIKKVKKRTKVKTITWYHDIEADSLSKRLKQGKINLLRQAVCKMQIKSEGIDAQLTDLPIVLHKRDAALLYKYWHRKADVHIPIVLEDKFKEVASQDKGEKSNKLQLLFIGAYGWTNNIVSIRWFCENVMSKITDWDVIFNVAGFGMEKLINDDWIKPYKNVRILGTIDDLSETYQNADVVVEPIIVGSGMKVKTAEALMFGKEVIGSPEAFVGYDGISENICYTPDDYIKKIKLYLESRPLGYIQKNRDYFIENFTPQAIENILRKALNELSNLHNEYDKKY